MSPKALHLVIPAAYFLLLQIGCSTGDSGGGGDWATKALPPKYEGKTPFTIEKIDISRNHVDQELVSAEFVRTPEIIRVLPKEMKLVILPVGGGRFDLGTHPGIAASPQQSGAIHSITDMLIDYRGKIPGGARAYIEMTAANAV